MITKIKYIIDNENWIEFHPGCSKGWTLHQGRFWHELHYDGLMENIKKVVEVEIHEYKKRLRIWA